MSIALESCGDYPNIFRKINHTYTRYYYYETSTKVVTTVVIEIGKSLSESIIDGII